MAQNVRIPQYLKRAGRSLGYAVGDTLAKHNPTVVNILGASKNARKDISRSMSDISKSTSGMSAKFADFKSGPNFVSNVMDDMKSGNWYNDRSGDSIDDMLDDIDNEDWGDNNTDDSSSSNDSKNSSKHIIAGLDKTTSKLSKSFGYASARTAEYIVSSNRASSKAIYELTGKGINQISSILLNIDNKVEGMINLNQYAITHYQNASVFYTKTTQTLDRMNTNIQNLTDTMSKMEERTRYLDPYYNKAGRREKANPLASGIFDMNEYIDMVKDNFTDVKDMLGDIFGAGRQLGGKNGKNVSLLQTALTTALDFAIPQFTKDAMKSFNEALNDAIITGLRQTGSNLRGGNSIIGQLLGNIFFPKTGIKTQLNTANYEKGPVPWDGIAKKSLTEVIPTYLAKIYASLGGEERYYDYETGKFETIKNIRGKFEYDKRQYAKRAGGDFYKEAIKKTDSEQIRQEIEKYFVKAFNGNENYTKIRQNKNNAKYMEDFGLSPESMAILLEVMREADSRTDWKGSKKDTFSRMGSAMGQEQYAYRKYLQSEESKNTSIFNNLQNTGISDVVDKHNKNQLDYLSGIYQMTANIYGYLYESGIGRKSRRGRNKRSGAPSNLFNIDKDKFDSNVSADGSSTGSSKVTGKQGYGSKDQDRVNRFDPAYYGMNEDEFNEFRKNEQLKKDIEGFKDDFTGANKDQTVVAPDGSGTFGKVKVAMFKAKTIYEQPFVLASAALNKLTNGINQIFWGTDDGKPGIIEKLTNKLDSALKTLEEKIRDKKFFDDGTKSIKDKVQDKWKEFKNNTKDKILGKVNEETGKREGGFVGDFKTYFGDIRQAQKNYTQERDDALAKAMASKESGSGSGLLRRFSGGASDTDPNKKKSAKEIYEDLKNGGSNFAEQTAITLSNFLDGAKEAGKVLFGREDGKETLASKISNTFSKLNKDKVKEGGKATAIGAGIGGAAGLLFGSPIIGAIVGSSIGFITKSDKAKDVLFGKLDEKSGERAGGIIPKSLQKKLKKAAPNITIGAIAGAAFGPVGIVGNLLIGSGMGLVTSTQKFHNFLFGDPNDEKDKGILGTIRDKIIDPLNELGHNLSNRIKEWGKSFGKNMAQKIRTTFTNGITNFLVNTVGASSEFKKFLGKMEKVGDTLLTPLKKLAQIPGYARDKSFKRNTENGYDVYDAKLGRNLTAEEQIQKVSEYNKTHNRNRINTNTAGYRMNEQIAKTSYSDIGKSIDVLNSIGNIEGDYGEATAKAARGFITQIRKTGIDSENAKRLVELVKDVSDNTQAFEIIDTLNIDDNNKRKIKGAFNAAQQKIKLAEEQRTASRTSADELAKQTGIDFSDQKNLDRYKAKLESEKKSRDALMTPEEREEKEFKDKVTSNFDKVVNYLDIMAQRMGAVGEQKPGDYTTTVDKNGNTRYYKIDENGKKVRVSAEEGMAGLSATKSESDIGIRETMARNKDEKLKKKNLEAPQREAEQKAKEAMREERKAERKARKQQNWQDRNDELNAEDAANKAAHDHDFEDQLIIEPDEDGTGVKYFRVDSFNQKIPIDEKQFKDLELKGCKVIDRTKGLEGGVFKVGQGIKNGLKSIFGRKRNDPSIRASMSTVEQSGGSGSGLLAGGGGLLGSAINSVHSIFGNMQLRKNKQGEEEYDIGDSETKEAMKNQNVFNKAMAAIPGITNGFSSLSEKLFGSKNEETGEKKEGLFSKLMNLFGENGILGLLGSVFSGTTIGKFAKKLFGGGGFGTILTKAFSTIIAPALLIGGFSGKFDSLAAKIGQAEIFSGNDTTNTEGTVDENGDDISGENKSAFANNKTVTATLADGTKVQLLTDSKGNLVQDSDGNYKNVGGKTVAKKDVIDYSVSGSDTRLSTQLKKNLVNGAIMNGSVTSLVAKNAIKTATGKKLKGTGSIKNVSQGVEKFFTTKGSNLTNAAKNLAAGRVVDGAENVAADIVDESGNVIASNVSHASVGTTALGGEVAENVGEKAVQEVATGSAKTMIEKLFASDGKLTKIFVAIGKHFGKDETAIASGCSKIGESLAESLGKASTKIASFAGKLAKAMPYIQVANIALHAINAWGNAETILGVTSCTNGQRIIACMISAINSAIPFVGDLIPNKTIVNIFMKVAPIMGIDVSDLEEQREEATEEVEGFNEFMTAQTGNVTNYSIEQYNQEGWEYDEATGTYKQGKSRAGIFTKAGNAIKSGVTHLKQDGIVNTIKDQGAKAKLAFQNSKLGKAVSNIATKRKERGEINAEFINKYTTGALPLSSFFTVEEDEDSENPLSGYDKFAILGSRLALAPAILIGRAGHSIVQKFKDIGSGIKNIASMAKDSFLVGFEGIKNNDVDSILDFSDVADTSKDYGIISPFVNQIGIVSRFAAYPVALIKVLGMKIKNKFVEIGTNIKNSFTAIINSDKFNYMKNGDIAGLWSDKANVSDDNSNVMNGFNQALNFYEKLQLTIPTAISWLGHKIANGFTSFVSNVKSGHERLSELNDTYKTYAKNGDVSSIWSSDWEVDEENPLDGVMSSINSINRIIYTVPAGIHHIGSSIGNWFSNKIDIVSSDNDSLNKSVESLKTLSDSGKPKEVMSHKWNASDGDPLGGIFKASFGLSKLFYSGVALFKKLFNPVLEIIEDVTDSVSSIATKVNNIKDTAWSKICNVAKNALGGVTSSLSSALNGTSTTTTTSRTTTSGSGSLLAGGDSGFVSQIDPKYSGSDYGLSGTTFASKGCGPAVAAMAASSLGKNLSVGDAVRDSRGYQNNDGVTIDYFENALRSKGISTRYIAGGSSSDLYNSIASGNKVVLLGQDASNTSKANSPFGPGNHYVLATGLDRSGNVVVNDPELNGPRTYSPDILNHTKFGVAANSGSGSKLRRSTKLVNNKLLSKYITGGSSVDPKQIWDYLRDKGFNEFAVAGIMGCWSQESGCNPTTVEGYYLSGYPGDDVVLASKSSMSNYCTSVLFPAYSGKVSINKSAYLDSTGQYYLPGVGLAQWTGPNVETVMNWCQSNNVDWRSLGGQLNYFWSDYQGRSTTQAKMSGVTSVEEATANFMDYYEMGNNPGFHSRHSSWYNARVADGKTYYNQYKGSSITTTVDSGTYTGSADDSTTSSSSSSGGLLSLISNIGSAITKGFNKGLNGHFGITDDDSSSSSSTDSSSSSSSYGSTGSADQQAVVNQMASWKGKLAYTQDSRRNQDPDVSGAGDCSSTVNWAYKKALGVDIGGWSGAQISNSNTYTVASGGSKPADHADVLQPGDIILYGDASGNHGHSEMYAGNGIILSHGGPDAGPQERDLATRQHAAFNCIRRYVGFKSGSGSGLNDLRVRDYDELAMASGGSSGLLIGSRVASRNYSGGSSAIATSTTSNRVGRLYSGGDSTGSSAISSALIENIKSNISTAGTTGVNPQLVNKLLSSIASLLNTVAGNTAPIKQIYDTLSEYVERASNNSANNSNTTTTAASAANKAANSDRTLNTEVDSSIQALAGVLAELAKG